MHAHSEADASDLTVIDNDQNLSQSSRLDGDACAQTDYLSPEAETCSSEDELPAMENLTLDDEADEADEDDDFVLFDLAGESLTSEPGNILDEAVKLARSASAEVGKSLEGLALDERLEQLQKKAFRLAAWENPARRTIGIVGDSAAGKCSKYLPLLCYTVGHSYLLSYRQKQSYQLFAEHPQPCTQSMPAHYFASVVMALYLLAALTGRSWLRGHLLHHRIPPSY